MKQNNVAFGRISDKVYKEIKSLDDLIDRMRFLGTTESGERIVLSGMQDAKDFKHSLEFFRESMKEDLPAFTDLDILKFHKYQYALRGFFEWANADKMLTCIEYELRKAQENDK